MLVLDVSGFVEETFDDELNQIYDTLMRKKPQPAPDSEVMMLY